MAHPSWTDWCNGFLTRAGFKNIGGDDIESRLRNFGCEGGELLRLEFDLGGTPAWTQVLFDSSRMRACVEDWIEDAKAHCSAFHVDDVNTAGCRRCI
jgi:hypothetical protein